MNKPSVDWLCEVLTAERPAVEKETPIGPISIDSRSLKPGDTFWAIQGVRDGHEFVIPAFAKGAKLAIVNHQWRAQNLAYAATHPIVTVTNTRTALATAGRVWRAGLSCRVLGITGTNGKTSTKDLILRLLAMRFRTSGTAGNLNNDLGVPLTLLDVTRDTEIAVIEMGANHPGEIEPLCDICQPTHALVTSIGKAHLEGFGTLQALARTKGALYDAVAVQGVAFVPTDDELCRTEAAICRHKVGYGFLPKPIVWNDEFHSGRDLKYDDRGCARFEYGDYRIELGIPGKPAAIAALAALTVAGHFGIGVDECRAAIKDWSGVHGRVDIFVVAGITVIDDTYNANPPSMLAALETLSNFRGQRHVAILGDMNELGAYAKDEHRRLGHALMQFDVDQTIFLGPQSRYAADAALGKSANVEYFPDYESFESEISRILHPGDIVLIKASRGMRLERVVEKLKAMAN